MIDELILKELEEQAFGKIDRNVDFTVDPSILLNLVKVAREVQDKPTAQNNDLANAVKKYLEDAGKTPPWESAGSVWAEMLEKLNLAFMIHRETPLKPTTAEHMVKILNEALAADPEAMKGMFIDAERVQCNQALADHPTIEVYEVATDVYFLSVLGLLRGLIDREHEVLVMVKENKLDDQKKPIELSVITKFTAMSKEEYLAMCEASAQLAQLKNSDNESLKTTDPDQTAHS